VDPEVRRRLGRNQNAKTGKIASTTAQPSIASGMRGAVPSVGGAPGIGMDGCMGITMIDLTISANQQPTRNIIARQ
jgi:hypothetical protein